MLLTFAIVAGLAIASPAMVRIPAGSYRPLYSAAGEPKVRVAAFALDRDVVTRGEFLRFVTRQPAWRRGAVRAVFADASYLRDWPGALEAGPREALAQPVRNVSWFAAKAYCSAQGKRLPTADEWEYAASASATRRDASRDAGFRAHLLALYASRHAAAPLPRRAETNAYGVRGLHDLGWEWTLDFNSVVVPDDSRAAGSGADARDRHLYCASAAIGASDPTDYPAFMRYAVRAGLTARTTLDGLGFRCAATQVT